MPKKLEMKNGNEMFRYFVITIVPFSKQAIDLINKWEPIDTADALELLTPLFTNKAVRQYAVSRLKQASNEVCCFLSLI